jgi:hypothetical protein
MFLFTAAPKASRAAREDDAKSAVAARTRAGGAAKPEDRPENPDDHDPSMFDLDGPAAFRGAWVRAAAWTTIPTACRK